MESNESNIYLDCILNREYLPANTGSTLFLAVQIAYRGVGGSLTAAMPGAGGEMPVDMCLLIDKSGSMCGEKLNCVKDAAIEVVNKLKPTDRLTVLAFSSDVETVVKGDLIDKQLFEDKIRGIKCGGSTRIYDGLTQAQYELNTESELSKNSVKKIMLLSDGLQTDEKTDQDYVNLAQDIRNSGASITAMGLGNEYSENLLSLIAQNSGGLWQHISSPKEVVSAFFGIVTDAKTTVKTKPEVVLHFADGVEFTEILKGEPQTYEITNAKLEENKLRIPIDDIKSDGKQTLTIKLHSPPRPEGQCRLIKLDLFSWGDIMATRNVIVNYTDDPRLTAVENSTYPRGAFLSTKTRILTSTGISGDDKALADAEQVTKIMQADAGVAKLFGEDTKTLILAIEKTKKGDLSKEDEKVLKEQVTTIKQ